MENNGYFSDYGTIWYSSSSSDGVRIFYLETKQVHPIYSYERTRPRLQEVGRYYYQTDRSAVVSTDGSTKNARDI